MKEVVRKVVERDEGSVRRKCEEGEGIEEEKKRIGKRDHEAWEGVEKKRKRKTSRRW